MNSKEVKRIADILSGYCDRAECPWPADLGELSIRLRAAAEPDAHFDVERFYRDDAAAEGDTPLARDESNPMAMPHTSPDDCPTWYDWCHCTVENLVHNIERAERAEGDEAREVPGEAWVVSYVANASTLLPISVATGVYTDEKTAREKCAGLSEVRPSIARVPVHGAPAKHDPGPVCCHICGEECMGGQKMEYKVLTGYNIGHLETQVEAKLAEGWLLVGGVCVIGYDYTAQDGLHQTQHRFEYHQAITRGVS